MRYLLCHLFVIYLFYNLTPHQKYYDRGRPKFQSGSGRKFQSQFQRTIPTFGESLQDLRDSDAKTVVAREVRKDEVKETDRHMPLVSSWYSRERTATTVPAELLATACLRVIGSYDS